MHIATIYRDNQPDAFGVWPTSRTFGRSPLIVCESLKDAEMFVFYGRLALLFTSKLQSSLGDDWAKVASGESHPNDLCDANFLMIEAFSDVFGREPYFPSDVEEGYATEAQMDADADTLDGIWDTAFALWGVKEGAK